jgi:hypothetical protein
MFRNLFQKDDLLKKYLLETYNFNLLSIPRENASVGDLYIREGKDKRLSTPSNIVHFFESGFKLPIIIQSERLADVSGTISKDISTDIGFQFLEGFLNLLGSGLLGTKFKTFFRNTKGVKFSFNDATRDYIDANLLLEEFGRHKLKETDILNEEGRRYYIATGVIRSPSVSVIATDNSNKAVDIKTELAELIDPSVNVDSQNSTQGLITFTGNHKLAFGIELYELKYNNITNRLRLKLTDEPFIVRGKEKTHKVLKPVIIGDPDDPFITVM